MIRIQDTGAVGIDLFGTSMDRVVPFINLQLSGGTILQTVVAPLPPPEDDDPPQSFRIFMNAFWNHAPIGGSVFLPSPQTGGMVSITIPGAYIRSSKRPA
jgi:hypothetical protein